VNETKTDLEGNDGDPITILLLDELSNTAYEISP